MLFRPQKIAVTAGGRGDGRRRGDGRAARRRPAGSEASASSCSRTGRRCARSISTRSIPDNAPTYWDRDERHDLAVSLNRGRPALDALCRVLEKWIAHMQGVAVTIRPQSEIDDKRWVWHVGLDAEASALLNDLYNRVDVDAARMERLLCLFELTFAHPGDMRPAIAGRPVYLAMAMDADRTAEAEAAEPPSQPAARPAAMTLRDGAAHRFGCMQ